MTDLPSPEVFDLDRVVQDLGAPPAAPLPMPKQVLHGGTAPAARRRVATPRWPVIVWRSTALSFSLIAAAVAALMFLSADGRDGLNSADIARAVLVLVTTWWLSWGAAQAVGGLLAHLGAPRRSTQPIRARTVIIVPVYNEDPVATFARIAAMEASLTSTGARDRFAFAILSDTRDEATAAAERRWFLRLLEETGGEGRIFYRRRARNTGKKAGNIEEFIQASGAAFDFALILDADSLMDGATIVEMVRRMEAKPRLGLLQTLPQVVRARTRFGRAMQFSAAMFSPVFARGIAAMQGQTGPFWGHNALVRISAFAASCGLPELPGKAPFGGHILSHDYVEAAMLARAGWQVRLDVDLDGSFEEGPETVIDHAKRDRRWCQGNLQHKALVTADRIAPWHRFTFVQGIFAYLSPLLWIAFLGLSILAAVMAVPPTDYFEPMNPVPVFPLDETWKGVALIAAVLGLLFLPKLLIWAQAALTGRAAGFGGALRALGSTLAEIVLSSLLAPVMMMFQTRSVLQVVMGLDAGWPAQSREGSQIPLPDAWRATRWITLWGAAGLGAIAVWAPELTLWLLPVLVPMIAAPVLVSWLSAPSTGGLFRVPSETETPAVLRRHAVILRRWRGDAAVDPAALPAAAPPPAAAAALT